MEDLGSGKKFNRPLQFSKRLGWAEYLHIKEIPTSTVYMKIYSLLTDKIFFERICSETRIPWLQKNSRNIGRNICSWAPCYTSTRGSMCV